MYKSSYNILSDTSELPNLVNNSFHQSFDQIQAIERIKNSLKRSAEEFEAKQLLKKMKFVESTDLSNVTYATELTNDISYVEQVKNSSSNINEVSEIIDKEIEFLNAQKSSLKDDKFQEIIKELFPNELINKKKAIESEICHPVILSSNFDQRTYLQSPPSTDIISLAWSLAVLSSDNNLECETKESVTWSDLTNDVSSSDPIRETNQKMPETMKRSWTNPEYRKMRTEAIKRSWEKEENSRKKKSEFMKRTWEDPEYRKKRSDAMKRTSENSKYRKKVLERQKANNQKTIERMMEAFTTETFVVKKPTKTYQKLRKN